VSVLDETHRISRKCWVPGADGHSVFPIQNLPLGVFRREGESLPQSGVAIGDFILSLPALAKAGLLEGEAQAALMLASAEPVLNGFLSAGPGPRRALRKGLVSLLDADSPLRGKAESLASSLLHAAGSCHTHLPCRVGDYTDFYAGIHHATNVGRQFRPDQPLLPNYKYVPIGYHGRASTVSVSGTRFHRPRGQRKPVSDTAPSYGPTERLDYELELGVWVGQSNLFGEPIPIGQASEHIGGFCLLNDWSARDIQAWEYQPLGPFLAKSFATTVSPWVVTPEALAPFRAAQPPRPEGDPAPLPYLYDKQDQMEGALAITLEVFLETPALLASGHGPHKLSAVDSRSLYWTVSQLLTHHTCNGCRLEAGDLLGSGTISGPSEGSFGSLLEITEGGRKPVELANGETRRFLEDGDTVILRATCSREGYATIGFGDCRGTVLSPRL
jgi:fumarylacetoacetase